MNWLITGGCGFIGINLIKNLLKGDNTIRILDDLSVGKREYLQQVCDVEKDIELFTTSITNIETVVSLCKNVDVIIHLAARSGVRESVEFPAAWFDNNVVGTFNILEAARINNVRKVVMASSSAVIGNCNLLVHEEIPAKPISPYGASKAVMEAYAFAYSYSYGINTTCLRFSNVYGPYSLHKGSLVAKFIRRLIKDEVFNVYGDGEQIRDFIFTEDLIDAIKMCVKSDSVGGEVFQLCSGYEISVNVVIDKILEYFDGDKIDVVKNVESKIGDMRTNSADNSKIKKMLGWEPKVNFDEGLEKTIMWFKKNMNEIKGDCFKELG